MKLLLSFIVLSIHVVLINGQKQLNDSVIPFKKAALLSACIPGGGQVYNSIHTSGRKNAFWKVPLIAAGIGGTTYLLIQNQRLVQSIKTEYNQRQIGGAVNPNWVAYDDLALVSLYDQYARLRDLSILGIGAVYAIQILDAAVEAHFLSFDVSKDLSLLIRPSVINSSALGMTAKITLK